jgi:ABC-type multidrug transport system fused ATPase/permease subunit
VLADDKIVQSGTYAELMRQGGEYAALARRQIA